MSKQLSISATVSAFTMTLFALAISVGEMRSEAAAVQAPVSAFAISAATE